MNLYVHGEGQRRQMGASIWERKGRKKRGKKVKKEEKTKSPQSRYMI